ncbi:MAG: hypothetical protein U9N56_01475 [Actinomycetota bacterium]|nr:hypothetical protein [Actinomycetota bacterium]
MPRKRRHRLRIDAQVDDSTLIELDTKQHFSSARLSTFPFYEGMQHDLDLEKYRELCSQYGEAADRSQRTREAVGFAFPGGRIAQRAYFDACKDLLAAAYGYRLIRIPILDGEFTSEARLALKTLL